MAGLSNSLAKLLNDSMAFPNLRLPNIEIPVDGNLASEFYKRLAQWIGDFDSQLDEEHEVGVRLISFGQTFVFHLNDMGYWNPSLIVFHGVMDSGSPVELIQHVSQISILLMKLPKQDPSKPKRTFGFVSPEINQDGEAKL